jgi:hypothetical protein
MQAVFWREKAMFYCQHIVAAGQQLYAVGYCIEHVYIGGYSRGERKIYESPSQTL